MEALEAFDARYKVSINKKSGKLSVRPRGASSSSKNAIDPRTGKPSKCYNCGSDTHYASQCPKPKGGKGRGKRDGKNAQKGGGKGDPKKNESDKREAKKRRDKKKQKALQALGLKENEDEGESEEDSAQS